VTYWATALVLIPAVPVAVVVPTFAVAGLGMGLAYAPLSLVVLSEATPGAEGSVTAGLQLSDTLGTALGTGIAGAIIAAIVRSGFSQGVGIGAAFAVAAAVGLAGAVLSPRLRGALARPAGRPVQTDELDLIA